MIIIIVWSYIHLITILFGDMSANIYELRSRIVQETVDLES